MTRGSSESRLQRYAVEDFPRLPDSDAPLSRVDREPLLETIARVAAPASRDESRPVLTGILVRFEGGQARDGGDRLLPAGGQGDGARRAAPELEAIIPARALDELARIAGRRREIELGMLENHVVFGVGRRLADDAPDRRPVPELPAAAARRRSSTRSRCRARSRSTSCAAPP